MRRAVRGLPVPDPSNPLPSPSEENGTDASDRVAQRGVCSTLDTKRRAEVRHLRTELTRALRAYATVTAEAARPLRGILCSIPENTSQECATERCFKDVLTAVSFQECAASRTCGSIFPALSYLFISSARLEAKVLRFDGCVGYARPIHTHNFGPLYRQIVIDSNHTEAYKVDSG
jgi:hypothetical protein